MSVLTKMFGERHCPRLNDMQAERIAELERQLKDEREAHSALIKTHDRFRAGVAEQLAKWANLSPEIWEASDDIYTCDWPPGYLDD